LLRQFATISGTQVLFMMEKVQGEQTNAIDGEYSPYDALELMLAGTALYVMRDEAIDGFVVGRQQSAEQRAEGGRDRNRSRAISQNAPTPKNDTSMKNHKTLRDWLHVLLVSASLTNLPANAQQAAPTAQPNKAATDESEEVILSPFFVDASQDQGSYRATSSLAGTRVRTELVDIASSISVVTKEFLRDTGATNNQSLLVYTTNTEVGGLYGNYGGVGNTYIAGASEPSLVRPNTNTRVRGLDSADNTRDYFLTNIPWDSYNVDRVDLQRGPNSILFGIGSPAGIINASVNAAAFKDTFKLENRYGSFGSNRNTLDFNKVILDQELAIRISALDDRAMYRQKPAFSHDKRLYGAVRWDPKLFNMTSAHTTLRANFEHGDVTANRPLSLPPTDLITSFFSSSLNKTTFDPYYAWTAGIVPQGTGVTIPVAGESRIYWLRQGNDPAAPVFYYNGATSNPISIRSALVPGAGSSMTYAIGPTGLQDSQIAGFTFAPTITMSGYNYYSIINNMYNPNDPATKGAGAGFYKDKALIDSSIFDFYGNLLGGTNQKQWQNWDAFNLSLDQTFFNNRLGFQVVYDHQKYNDGSTGIFGNAISVDLLANTYEAPWPYSTSVKKYNGTGTAGTNANAGRAYVSGSGGGSSSINTRENLRATATGELRATDFLSKSWLTDILGRHVLTGLFSRETYDNESRSWLLFATDATWPDIAGTGPSTGGSNALTSKNRNFPLISYVSAPLFSASSASGLNIQPITASYSPSGSVNVKYYDSHWKPSTNPTDPTYVDPAATWTNAQNLGSADNNAQALISTQSENPANYVGWKNTTVNLLNAEKGDIDSLYTGGSKTQTITESKALTWQGYLWDDNLVGTIGWRRDTQKLRYNNAPINASTGVAGMSYDLLPMVATDKVSGNSKSWGLVLHEPKSIRNKLPWGTNISLTYNVGNNTRVQNRYSFSGDTLPNAKGETKDYGFVINTLDDRLTLKVTWYKTTVKDANMNSNPAAAVLGSNQSELWNFEMWGLANSLINLAAIANQIPTSQPMDFWDWAAGDKHFALSMSNPSNPAWQNDPSTLKEKAASESFLAQLQPQSWWDAYGFPVNVAKAQAKDWNNAIANWTPAKRNWDINYGYGSVHGNTPTGTIDTQSKGIEFELTGQVTKNWNVSANASKQTAEQISLGSALTQFIEGQHTKFASPAGDIRLWWGTDMGIRTYYNTDIYSTYLFLKEGNGRMVPEMSPWRANLVTNYSFDRGFLKGANVGLGYRWQQGVILGYGLKDDYTNLDINKPVWGKSTYAVDMWAGYERKLTNKINWRIQLNIRSLGAKVHLERLSVEPDGSTALARIVEGQTWFLANTLSF
jgi:outer membrane receptor protein involved in Fe transport